MKAESLMRNANLGAPWMNLEQGRTPSRLHKLSEIWRAFWRAQERYSEAEQLLDRAVAIIDMIPKGVGAYPRETSRLLGNLGALYEQTGRHQAAEPAFKRALRLLQQYKPDD